MAQQVFISYSSEDRERFVGKFAERLNSAGICVWYDAWEILPGDSLISKIFEQGIGDASALVAIVSKHSRSSRWVQEELNSAKMKQIQAEPRIISVVLDGSTVPKSINELARVDIADLDEYQDELARIVAALRNTDLRPSSLESQLQILLDAQITLRNTAWSATKVREELDACRAGMNHESWAVRVQSLVLAARIAARLPQHADISALIDDDWLRPDAAPPLYVPWLFGLSAVFGGSRSAQVIPRVGSQLVAEPTGYVRKTTEAREHFNLNLLQGLRTGLVAVDAMDSDVRHMLLRALGPRLQRALGWIGDFYFEGADSQDPQVRIRLLLSLSDLTQIEVFLNRHGDPSHVLTTVRRMADQICVHLTAEQIKHAATPLQEAVRAAPRLWNIELSTIFAEDDYPFAGPEQSERVSAIISFLDICIRTRGAYEGIGWESWRDGMVAFGATSRHKRLRELAEFAKRKVHTRPFSSRQ